MLDLRQTVQGRTSQGRVQTQSVGLLVCSCVTTSCLSTPQRKDKLREHMQRMHNPDREAKKADRIHRSKSLKLRAPSSDFESFMFKCRLCMMGFRRRGMLVSQRSCSRLSTTDLRSLTVLLCFLVAGEPSVQAPPRDAHRRRARAHAAHHQAQQRLLLPVL